MSLYSIKIKMIMQKTSTNFNIISTLILSFLINIPIYFHHTIRSDEEFHDAIVNLNKTLGFTYCGESEFYQTFKGKLVLIILTIIREFVVLVLEIVVSVLSIRHLNRYTYIKKTGNI